MGLTVNMEKCEFVKAQVFLSRTDSDSVNTSEEKVATIRDVRSAKEASEVRSFMGLVHYLAKFMPHVAFIAKAHSRVYQKVRYLQVGQRTADSFSGAEKFLMTQAKTSGYFRVDCRTRIVADASPVGLAAVPAQEQGGAWRAVSYASRSLTDVGRLLRSDGERGIGIGLGL